MRSPAGSCLPHGGQIAFLACIGAGMLFASPAMAGCIGHPEQNLCYTAKVEIAHNTTPVFYLPVSASGETPQSVATPRTPQAFASASSDSAHNGTLLVRTEVSDDDYYYAEAYAGLNYTFRLASKDSSTPADAFVPFNVQAIAFSLRNQTQFQGNASIELDQDGQTLLFASQRYLDGKETILFDVNQWINVRPDDDILVSLGAESDVDSYPGYGRYSSGVLLDPEYTISPEYASRYTLVGLPGGTTTAPAAVPEPATWAMMVSGFGLIGGTMRNRRKTAVSFA